MGSGQSVAVGFGVAAEKDLRSSESKGRLTGLERLND